MFLQLFYASLNMHSVIFKFFEPIEYLLIIFNMIEHSFSSMLNVCSIGFWKYPLRIHF